MNAPVEPAAEAAFRKIENAMKQAELKLDMFLIVDKIKIDVELFT